MTKEQAIKWLKDMLKCFDLPMEQYQIALEVAIKALEQPCEDCISREAVLDTLDTADKFLDEDRTVERYKSIIAEAYEVLPSVTPQEPKTDTWSIKEVADALEKHGLLEQEQKTGWIPIKTRPMTEEETEHYSEYMDMSIYDTYTILDCPLPDDGQEVLVSWGGNVMVDVFVRDDDGCYFEGVDIDEVDAWMSLPEPFKESEG